MQNRLWWQIPFALGVLVLLAVSSRIWSRPDDRLIGRMISEAPRLIDQLPRNETYPWELTKWFKALTQAGFKREAQRMATSIKDPILQSHALAAEVRGLFALRRMNEARAVANMIPNAVLRDQNLRIVSIGSAFPNGESGLAGGSASGLGPTSAGIRAVETAASIKNADSRSAGLVDTARTLRILGDDRAADVATREMTEQSAKDQASADQARTLALKRQPHAAIQTAEAIQDPGRRLHALAQIAHQLLDRSRVVELEPETPKLSSGTASTPATRAQLRDRAIEATDRALAITSVVGGDTNAYWPSLVRLLGRTGRGERACEVARGIKDVATRSKALNEVVASLIDEGRAAEALEVARAIPIPAARCEALNVVVAGWSKNSTTEGLAPVAAELLVTAKAIEDPCSQSNALAHASEAILKAGMRAEALKAADAATEVGNKIRKPEEKAYALADAAGRRAEAEPGMESATRARQALEAAAVVRSPYDEDGPLHRAAHAVLHAVPHDKAIEVVSSIEDPSARALALTALGDILGGYGWDQRVEPAAKAAAGALEAATALSDPRDRATLVPLIMDIAARADLIAGALEAARSIPDSHPAERSQALRDVGRILAQRDRFDEAIQVAQACAPADKLDVYATILETLAIKDDNQRRFSRGNPRDRRKPAFRVG